MLAVLKPFAERGVPVIGLEPSCLLTLRDEFKSMLPGRVVGKLAERAMMFEEFIATEQADDRLALPLRPLPPKRALLHGTCHPKAFAAMGAAEPAQRRGTDRAT